MIKINRKTDVILKQSVPYILALILIYCFASLGLWQLDRAKEKTSELNAFNSPDAYISVKDLSDIDQYKKIKATGRYLNDKQIIIDNIIRDGKIGQMIISPFEIDKFSPLILVNRGWLPKNSDIENEIDIDIHDKKYEIKGLSGYLPKVAIRESLSFKNKEDWPRVGIYPTIDEIKIELGKNLYPFIILLDQNEEYGFQRNWEPKLSDPATNYGYAFQWFLMCFCSFLFLIYRIRKSFS